MPTSSPTKGRIAGASGPERKPHGLFLKVDGLQRPAPGAEATPFTRCARRGIDYLSFYASAYRELRTLARFNACGADPAGDLAERHDPETHLIPLAIDAATGRGPPLQIFGADYPTADGTCERDYIQSPTWPRPMSKR